MERTDIKSMTLSELSQEVRKLALPAFRASQIYKWLHVRGVFSFDEMSDLSKELRSRLNENYIIRICGIERRQESKQNETVKYLFKLYDGEYVESVLMKYKYGYTLCVSTQVGCRMGCKFCASTLAGFVRHLSASEILGQIHAAQRDCNIRVSHVVLMGMGEPLDNYDNVMRFLELVSDENGLNIGMRNISLSTCGIVPKIYELMEKKLQLTLSVSIHAPNDEIRSKIMPINKKYPMKELLEACKKYADYTGRRISFEYTMIDGVNDSVECAAELSRKLRGILSHVNLIPANEFGESPFSRSRNETIEKFVKEMKKNSVNVTLRRSLGSDIDASCGQLRLRNQKGG